MYTYQKKSIYVHVWKPTKEKWDVILDWILYSYSDALEQVKCTADLDPNFNCVGKFLRVVYIIIIICWKFYILVGGCFPRNWHLWIVTLYSMRLIDFFFFKLKKNTLALLKYVNKCKEYVCMCMHIYWPYLGSSGHEKPNLEALFRWKKDLDAHI